MAPSHVTSVVAMLLQAWCVPWCGGVEERGVGVCRSAGVESVLDSAGAGAGWHSADSASELSGGPR